MVNCKFCGEKASHFVPTTSDCLCGGCLNKAINGFIKKAQEFDWTNFKPVIYNEIVKKYG